MKLPTHDRRDSRSAVEDCAGPLFVSGAHAAADIVCETGTVSGRCGTVCTGSWTNECC
jgi:uncharacterized membrane protein